MQELFIFFGGFFTGVLLVYFYLKKIYKNKIYTDPITGLKNAYYFNENYQTVLCPGNVFILLDIDNFKQYNTRFGYEVADELLKLFADKVQRFLPENAEFIRYKFGDEFLIILKRSSVEFSKKLILSLKNEMESSLFNLNGSTIILRFSVGYSSIMTNDSRKSLVKRLNDDLNYEKEQKKL